MNQEVFNTILNKYPQIGLPIKKDQRKSRLYEDTVLRGLPNKDVLNDFSECKGDCLETEETPAGHANILYIEDRNNFEMAIQKLAHRCEPTNIPASMGASTISGLINWEKIHNYEKEYKENGGCDWNLEFKLFIANPSNYKDSLIILSSGNYSAVDTKSINKTFRDNNENICLSDEEWKKDSIIIRKYHELTHFVCQKLYPEHKSAIRDEIIADAIGIIAAFGEYKSEIAKLFLGLENDEYREGGRLQNYYFDKNPQDVQKNARDLIDKLKEFLSEKKEKSIFDNLKSIEENEVGLQLIVEK